MSERVRLTQHAKTSGWAAKVGPEVLSEALATLPVSKDPRLLVGIESSDDAAVYQLRDDLAIVTTLDFFTPIVDDPYTFGLVAAANSLSDVYAMGTEPEIAMNIVCFPNCLEPSVLHEILKGGAAKCAEAGCLVVGGHTVQDDEPKFGLSVTASIHPDKILKNSEAKPGDVLVLTKPLGVGIINTALKGGLIGEFDDIYLGAVESMMTLNMYGKRAMDNLRVNACTDITGFGLIGHIYEMAEGADVTIEINSSDIPVLKGAKEFAEMGLVPEGSYDNRAYVGDNARFDIDDPVVEDILYDPETSGGLLISLPKDQAELLLENLKDSKLPYGIVGRVTEKQDKYIIVK